MLRQSVVGYVLVLFCVPAALLFVISASAQQDVDWDAVEISTHHVAGTVHYVAGRGGNIGLSVGEDGVIMIDDQFAPLTDRILEATQGRTTILISHRFSTVRHADRICVLEHGRVVGANMAM